jgi:diguanylate cyclase (GGDEF)-like protein
MSFDFIISFTEIKYGMGIRSKILLAFILCFGTMVGISLSLLHTNMYESYDAIERNEIAVDVERMVQSIEISTTSLRLKTRDLAAWTEMVNYVHQRDPEWERENLSLSALESADLSFGMIFNLHGDLLSTIAPRQIRQELNFPLLLNGAYAAIYKSGAREPQCGLMKTDIGLMLTCWAGILRSDLSGDIVGTVVLGRLLDASRILKLRRQTGALFEISATPTMPKNLNKWSGKLSANSIGSSDFWTLYEPNVVHLFFRLQDILKQDVGVLTLDKRRPVREQGERLYRQTREQLLWVIVIMTAVLALTLNFLLIDRLRRFAKQLVELAKKSTWNTRIDIQGNDELGLVATNVNKLLALIESQVEGLNALSMTDALTGLSNRRAFDIRLAQEYSREQRNGKPLALLVLDVDHFKQYNDHYGHPAGDTVLQALADILRRSKGRISDLAVRLGGEEFGILLPESDIKGAKIVAEHIHRLLREANIEHTASLVEPRLTVSIGIAIAHEETIEEFVQRADQALYQAKREGRNRSCNAEESKSN